MSGLSSKEEKYVTRATGLFMLAWNFGLATALSVSVTLGIFAGLGFKGVIIAVCLGTLCVFLGFLVAFLSITFSYNLESRRIKKYYDNLPEAALSKYQEEQTDKELKT